MAKDSIYVSDRAELAGDQIATEGPVGILGDLPIQETPFSVKSYTSTFLENRQALTLTDALDSDASILSVSASSRGSPNGDVFLSRGFRGVAVAVNGLFGLSDDLTNMYFVDRVDVFSGPSAFVMGAPESVGGVFNLQLKRAADRPYLLLAPDFVSKSVYGGRVDASRRFGPHNAFGARANGLYREGEGEIRDSRLLIEGASLGLDLRSRVVLLSLDADYLRNNNKAFQYVLIPVADVVSLPPPMPTNLSTQPVWMDASTSEKAILGRADVNISPKWVITAGSGFSPSSTSIPGYCPVLLLDYSGTVVCEQRNQLTDQNNYSTDFGVRGKIHIGAVAHSITTGWNRVHDKESFGDFNDYGPSQPYNLYASYRPTSPNYSFPAVSADYVIDDEITKGWYLGDTAGLLHGRLLLTGGFRRTTMSGKETYRGTSPSRYHQSAYTPSAAALFKATSHLSLYGNFIQALEPGLVAPPDTRNAGEIFPPIVSNQVEVGAKLEGRAWISTIALYRISEANGVVSTATNPPTFSQDGRQVNTGLEINFAGDLIHGLHAILSASFIESRQRSTGDPTTEGKRTANVPAATERVNLNWDIPRTKVLALDCNLMFTGAAAFDATNSYDVPAWISADLGVRYSFPKERPFTIRAQVANVANTPYWVSVFSGGLVPSGPRVVTVSISKSF
ncbi:TonB-dependent receptor [Tunturiibacter lichenicola]|uniref:TonB-dependent receptor n=1 Tax=Tunturiibacter lichenicola TaxID=2051959 RepID=UPI003D9B08E1